ncbi:MAG: hypothetical protein MUE82_08470, partial [Chloroflexi bacterium]|nr:hypothetical protein [Chloroflexota bacterium]
MNGDTAAPGSRQADEGSLLRLHAETLFDIDDDGRLAGTNEPEPEPPPRIFLVRGRTAHEAWFGSAVPAEAIARCRRAIAELPSWDGGEPAAAVNAPLRAAIAASGAVAAETSGIAFAFGDRRGHASVPTTEATPAAVGQPAILIDRSTAHLLETHFPYTRSALDARSPVVGVIREGVCVAACYCARKRPAACEAGVATAEAYRGQGLAVGAVLAWRDAVEA